MCCCYYYYYYDDDDDYYYYYYLLFIMDLNGRRQCNLYFVCNRFVSCCEQTAFQTCCDSFLTSFLFTRQDWERF